MNLTIGEKTVVVNEARNNVLETWLVLIFKGGVYVDGEVIDGELEDLIELTCTMDQFATAMAEAGYDITDLTLQYMRELIDVRNY